MNKKEKRYLIILFIFILITLITMALGIAFTYFNNKKQKENEVEIVVKKISLLMTYETANKIYFNGLDNIDYNYSFSITNESAEYKVNYKLNFNILTPAFEVESPDFSYNLNCDLKKQNDIDSVIKLDNKMIPTKTTSIGESTISPNQTHYCTLNIKYNGEKSNKVFIGNIELEKAIN